MIMWEKDDALHLTKRGGSPASGPVRGETRQGKGDHGALSAVDFTYARCAVLYVIDVMV